ncbi:uncharacterized protein LOC119395578 [Rhipicephalus sanguineus]|uniref:uncharacterized protein LOC119395578 n=1 Tax=Rhipicephalus sanguineus TaxID=34632 RepID=UPI0018939E28|nr:uncharacterized protein LOC119395578 [Rhipicephalus sanguineus]
MAAAGASSAPVEDVDLLYPELMSSKAIVNILKERYVKHPRLEELDKAALVQLYEQTVLPLPQREYRDTRSGRALSALRKHADSRRKRKASQDSSTDSTSTKLRKGSLPRDDDKGRQRPSDPHAKRGRKSSGGEWGSWDEEAKSKSSKRSVTNRCHGEGDGPPRKKHRTPITWP